MNYTDYEKLIQDAVKNPEEAPLKLKDVLEGLKKDFETVEAQTNLVKEQEKKIRDLQDTNMKLFIGQTGAKDVSEDDDDLEGAEAVDAFINKLMKGDK